MIAIEYIRNTPVWVWPLLAFLIISGLKSFNESKVDLKKIFILPVMFISWSIYSIFVDLSYVFLSLSFFSFTLSIGILIGFIINKNFRPISSNQNNELIMQGSWFPLALILFSFCITYVFSALKVVKPEFSSNISYSLLHVSLSGLLAGLFWGGIYYCFYTFRQLRGNLSVK